MIDQAWFDRLADDAIDYPEGLCGNRDEHKAHVHHSDSLGTFWCTADQSRRLPAAAERAWRPRGAS